MEKKYRDAFVREHNLQRQFEHKHLCSAYGEVGQDYEVNHSGSGSHIEGSVSAQEPLSAGSLFDFVVHSGPFEEDLARHYFAQLCSGLYQLHRNQFAHRDLKPENICLDDSFNLKIIDFGFTASIYEDRKAEGTINYFSPKQLEGEETNFCKDDIFTLGMILYIMVTGLPPFQKSSRYERYYKPVYAGLNLKFWTEAEKRLKRELDGELKQLISLMIHPDEEIRPLIQDVMTHPWMENFELSQNGQGDIETRMEDRHRQIQLALDEEQRLSTERAIATVTFDDFDKTPVIEAIQVDAANRVERSVKDYEFVVTRNHSFKTKLSSLGIFEMILSLFMADTKFETEAGKEQKYFWELDKEHWALTITTKERIEMSGDDILEIEETKQEINDAAPEYLETKMEAVVLVDDEDDTKRVVFFRQLSGAFVVGQEAEIRANPMVQEIMCE